MNKVPTATPSHFNLILLSRAGVSNNYSWWIGKGGIEVHPCPPFMEISENKSTGEGRGLSLLYRTSKGKKYFLDEKII